MKNNQLTGMLVGLFLLSTLLNVALIFKYNSAIHTIQHLEPRVREINIMQLLLNDTVEYNKNAKNPDMMRILQAINTPRPAKPAGK